MSRLHLHLDARAGGIALGAAGFALLWMPPLWAAALGLEAIATAFWVWSRASQDPSGQLARWSWVRRPAVALWLAAAAQVVGRATASPEPGYGPTLLLRGIEALGVVWAGLELLAALPLARPFSDMPGPLLALRPWLPALLPAAGFAVLWRHPESWLDLRLAREAAVVLLIVTVWLGVLRAFGRRQWTAGLRWLLVTDSAMAGLVVALDVVPPPVSLLLWLGACGGRTWLLIGELRGQTPRRGPFLTRAWKVASITASAAVAWPALVGLAAGPTGQPRVLQLMLVAVPAALAAAVTWRRLVEAPERRAVERPRAALSLGHGMAMLTMLLGPTALLLARWAGFAPRGLAPWLALLAAPIGVALAVPGRALEVNPTARAAARAAFRGFVGLERWIMGRLLAILRFASAPVRDLHTGDPQEYLLFIMGVALLALLLPLVR